MRAVVTSKTKRIHVAHNGAIGHCCPSVLSKASHSPLHNALGFNSSFLIVDHQEVAELHCTDVDTLSTLLTVPGGEGTEDSRCRSFAGATSFCHRVKLWEDPKAEPPLRVHSVVVKLTKGNSLLTDVWTVGWTIRVVVHAVPEAKVGAPCSSVVADNVIWIGDPVRSRGDVVIQQAGALLNKHSQVVLQDVLRLNAILDEEGPTHDVVDDVVLHQQPVGVVDGYSPVVGLMDCTTPHI